MALHPHFTEAEIEAGKVEQFAKIAKCEGNRAQVHTAVSDPNAHLSPTAPVPASTSTALAPSCLGFLLGKPGILSEISFRCKRLVSATLRRVESEPQSDPVSLSQNRFVSVVSKPEWGSPLPGETLRGVVVSASTAQGAANCAHQAPGTQEATCTREGRKCFALPGTSYKETFPRLCFSSWGTSHESSQYSKS